MKFIFIILLPLDQGFHSINKAIVQFISINYCRFLFLLTQFKVLDSIQGARFYSRHLILFKSLDFIPGARLYCKDSTLPRYSTLQFARIYLVCSTHIIIYCFFPCGAGVFFIKKIWLYETFSFNARSPLYRSIEILIYIYVYNIFFLFYLVN